ncbi:MAG: DUF4838 domain-containing protein [Clostridia bacterium]|nr:DUF4838 domain-containing protein [Clostridia bacterium]
MKPMLATQSVAQYPIVVAKNATEQERYAASELRYYLERITAAPFTISEDSADVMLAIGSAAAGLGVSTEGLGSDGFAVKTVGESIAIVGGKRGVIYGVYELLEQLGCRFFASNCEKIPTITELALPEIDTRQVPTLEFRDHNYYEFTNYPRFAVKSRINGFFAPIKEKFGGHVSYAVFCHSFNYLVSPELYGKEHPEYFALIDGERCIEPEHTQLCLTNPEVLEIAIESARRALKANPEARIMSITQNDWNRPCECEACRKIDEEEHSQSGTMLRFVNAIAERLEPEFPDVVFDTFAYQYTRPVPSITRPRHNVCVRLCSIEACFAHPFETCDDDRSVLRPDGTKSSFITDLTDWGKCCNRMYIWDYTTSFSHYPAPHPNWRVLQPNMRAFIKNNVKGVFEQANGASRGGVDLNELRAYVLAKLLWNAETDVSRHIREFTDEFYGAAAPFVRAYIDFLCDTVECENIHVGFNDCLDGELFRPEIVEKLADLINQGKAAVANDPLRLWRMGKLELSVRWVRMKRKSMLEGELDAEEANRFFADWQGYGMTRIDEWVSRETTYRALIRQMWRGTQFYEHWSFEGGEEL